jgi:uncharacterized SAM-binding protein YcdF (DUF218 family)
MRFEKMKNKKKIYLILGFMLVVVLLYIGILQFKISQYSDSKAPKNADYVIVLGAKVNRTVPSLALKSRIDSAAQYLKTNKDTLAIASGGKGTGEDISEAESIKEQLLKQGISQSRIILEDRSTNTEENLRFSKKLIPATAKRGIIVTNSFHVYRSLSIAKDNGLNLAGLAAKTPKSAIIKSYSREYLAITKYYLIKLIKFIS